MNILDPDAFYDSLASEYDAMTQFSARLEKQKSMLSQFADSRRIIDMGCGTGIHSIALAQLGARVVGIDVSAGMLERARAHAAGLGVAVDFVQGDFLSTPPVALLPAELLLCLGNSLPHIERAELPGVLAHWRALMAPGGVVVIQLLNYERILRERERIVNIRKTADGTVLRFYDFLDEGLQFNILTITETEQGLTHTLRSTCLSPFTDSDIAAAARAAGFAKVRLCSALTGEPFSTDATDCVAMLGCG
jgi:glycine/sarcosine N-methyltransferase